MTGFYAIIFLMDNSLRLEHRQVQKQIQKLSQIQIMALNYLTMENTALRDEIYREVNNNPALEIVREPQASFVEKLLLIIYRTELLMEVLRLQIIFSSF